MHSFFTPENIRKLFWCFQGVEKRSIKNEWIKESLRHISVNSFKKSAFWEKSQLTKISSIFKTGKKELLTNHRPVWLVRHVCVLNHLPEVSTLPRIWSFPGKSEPCLDWCPWILWRCNIFNLSRDLTRPTHWRVIQIYERELLAICHHPDKGICF